MSDFQDLPDRPHSLINLLFEAEEVIRWNQLFKIQFPSTISSWRLRWWGEGEVGVVGGRGSSSSPRCLLLVSSQPTDRRDIFHFSVFLFLRAVISLCSVVVFV